MVNENSLEALFNQLSVEKSKQSLSSEKLHLYYGLEFAMALIDGDMNDYLFNRAGGNVYKLKEALKYLKAVDVLGLVREALTFFEEALPENSEERQAMLIALDDDGIEGLDALTEDYYDIEESYWTLLLKCGQA